MEDTTKLTVGKLRDEVNANFAEATELRQAVPQIIADDAAVFSDAQKTFETILTVSQYVGSPEQVFNQQLSDTQRDLHTFQDLYGTNQELLNTISASVASMIRDKNVHLDIQSLSQALQSKYEGQVLQVIRLFINFLDLWPNSPDIRAYATAFKEMAGVDTAAGPKEGTYIAPQSPGAPMTPVVAPPVVDVVAVKRAAAIAALENAQLHVENVREKVEVASNLAAAQTAMVEVKEALNEARLAEEKAKIDGVSTLKIGRLMDQIFADKDRAKAAMNALERQQGVYDPVVASPAGAPAGYKALRSVGG